MVWVCCACDHTETLGQSRKLVQPTTVIHSLCIFPLLSETKGLIDSTKG